MLFEDLRGWLESYQTLRYRRVLDESAVREWLDRARRAAHRDGGTLSHDSTSELAKK